jgi:hypothetical protein
VAAPFIDWDAAAEAEAGLFERRGREPYVLVQGLAPIRRGLLFVTEGQDEPDRLNGGRRYGI